MKENVLKIIIATGLPGSTYPTTNSAKTCNAIDWFVIAWISPTGIRKTKPIATAKITPQIGSFVSQTSTVTIENTNATIPITANHQCGTS